MKHVKKEAKFVFVIFDLSDYVMKWSYFDGKLKTFSLCKCGVGDISLGTVEFG